MTFARRDGEIDEGLLHLLTACVECYVCLRCTWLGQNGRQCIGSCGKCSNCRNLHEAESNAFTMHNVIRRSLMFVTPVLWCTSYASSDRRLRSRRLETPQPSGLIMDYDLRGLWNFVCGEWDTMRGSANSKTIESSIYFF